MVMVFITCLLTVSVLSVRAQGAFINFHGIIQASSCEILNGSDQTVVLGNVGTTLFSGIGDVSPLKSFYISLRCPDFGPQYITATFNGNAASDPTLLALDNVPGMASGVAVRILNADGLTQVDLNQETIPIKLAAGDAAFTFKAQYQSLVERSQIIAGVANATVQFTLNYP
jgi:type 1 fimbria pilin